MLFILFDNLRELHSVMNRSAELHSMAISGGEEKQTELAGSYKAEHNVQQKPCLSEEVFPAKFI